MPAPTTDRHLGPVIDTPAGTGIARSLADYDRRRAAFTWAGARAALDGLPGGRGLNIAHEAVDRHAAGPRADHVALRHHSRSGVVTELTYRDLGALTSRFANVLRGLGVRRGERVFAATGRILELYVCALSAETWEDERHVRLHGEAIYALHRGPEAWWVVVVQESNALPPGCVRLTPLSDVRCEPASGRRGG